MSKPALILVLALISSAATGMSLSAFGSGVREPRTETITPVSDHEHASTIARLKPSKRARPVVAVLLDNSGAETTDFLVPFGILKRSDVAEVIAVAPRQGPVVLRPALAIKVDTSLQAFDQRYPDGADYVIVPALSERNEKIEEWLRAQAKTGAIIVGVCSGVQTLSEAGFLQGRSATGYWGDIDRLRTENPTMKWVQNRRYVVDRGVVTTTGITASVPVSLAIIEAIAGEAKALQVAKIVGARSWRAEHDTAAFRVEGPEAWKAALTDLLAPQATTFGVPVVDGVDEIALAFIADSYSRVFRNRVAVVSPSPTVRMKSGLELISDQRTGQGEFERLLGAPANELPARALDAALSDIDRTYGRATADKVAHQLEYARDSF